MKSVITFCIVFLALGLGLSYATQKAHISNGTVTPADVFHHVQALSTQLKQLERATGKPAPHPDHITIQHAAPREVYFAAENLYSRANRLCFEITGKYVEPPLLKRNISDIQPTNVLLLVQSAQKRIDDVLKKLDLPIIKPSSPKHLQQATPSDVLQLLMYANKQLAQLLYQKTTPGDAYDQLFLANRYLHFFTQKIGVPPLHMPTTLIEKNKRPYDVYLTLWQCLQQLQKLEKALGIKGAKAQLNHNTHTHRISPDEVVMLTKLILAKVRYLASLSGHTHDIPFHHYGYKLPSQVYAQAQFFLQQTQQLLQHTPLLKRIGS